MKISSKQKDVMTFFQLMQGDVFEYNGYFFMKISDVVDFNNDTRNAIRLENGWLVHYKSDDVVRYVDAELVIG